MYPIERQTEAALRKMRKNHCGNRTHLIIIILQLVILEQRSDNDLFQNGVQSGTSSPPPTNYKL